MDTRVTARKIAEESIVLLKNDEKLLPFPEGKRIAFFGRAQIGTVYSGNGSGAANVTGAKVILEECEKCGLIPAEELKAFYQSRMQEEEVTEKEEFDWTQIQNFVNSGVMYEIFGKYHPPLEEFEIPEELVRRTAEQTDTALLVIGRNSGGEECDRHLTEDYELTDSEKRLVRQIGTHFPKAVVILNTNGLIDLSWVSQYPCMKSLLFLGVCGEEGAAALAEILCGKVNPSGKLPVTIARKYEDYPSAGHFSWNKGHMEEILDYSSYGLSAEENGSSGFQKSPVTVYWEDIYQGYRYFDTFGKEVLFPFGHGLSYTSFQIRDTDLKKLEDGMEVTAAVRNTGKHSGKEVVQLYLSHSVEECPDQELKGFEKTKLLGAGDEERVRIRVPWKELAVYEEEAAAWKMLPGTYSLYLGTSSRDTGCIGQIAVEQEILVEQCSSRLSVRPCNRDKIRFLSSAGQKKQREGEEPERVWEFKKWIVGGEDISIEKTVVGNGCEGKADHNLQFLNEEADRSNAYRGAYKRNLDSAFAENGAAKLAELSVEELAALCVGYGPGTPFSAVGDTNDPPTIFHETGRPVTTNSHPAGFPGYVSPAIEEKGIFSVFYKDGPAGIGEIAWPTAMLTACAFNKSLWYEFGNAVGTECEKQKVDVWLAPAVNLHRNPLCGRNFEYFSEDPYLTGVCACRIAKGVQENHKVLVCPKHFAVNEQETYRRGSKKDQCDAVDSIVSERALRELYLKPFEMLVREAGISCIMTSFNKINGVFAGGSEDLCKHILREEWGFAGAVVTDWGDMDVVVDGAAAVAAGNDIVMPGGPPVIAQIMRGYRENRLPREAMEAAVAHLLYMIGKTRRFK